MNRLSEFVVRHSRLAWGIALLMITICGLLVAFLIKDMREAERLSLLATEAERRSISIMSQTLNGNMMGSLSLLGLIDPDIKKDTRTGATPNESRIYGILESVGRSFDADGVFVVTEAGLVGSSWDNSGRPSTGLNVKFRPYYQMAMQGMENVYAAVSLARGDRALYFSAPIYRETTNGTEAIGAVVARSGLTKVDNLLRDNADVALLLSPQGVVFASSHAEWIGHLSGEPTPERLKSIRELKQFGNMFENRVPAKLPFDAQTGHQNFDGHRYAVASARVQWNDPFGDWKLVLLEDLGRTVPPTQPIAAGITTGLALLFISLLILNILHSHHAQTVASSQLAEYAGQQEISARNKATLAAAGLSLQQAKTIEELGQAYLSNAHHMLGALQGVIYATDTDSSEIMKQIASFACTDAVPTELAPGEGLLGQCTFDRNVRVIDTSVTGTGDFDTIRSGLGETRPASVMMGPVLLNDRLLGVVEIALLTKPDERAREQFQELTALLAVNLEILGRTRHTESMLSITAAAKREMERLADMERFNRLTLDRESRILQLKSEVNELASLMGRPPVYESSALADIAATVEETARNEDVGPHQTASEEKLSLAELVDLNELQKLFSDFCNAIGIAAAIIDLEGNVLAASRWQRVCTDFHRVNPESCARCIESDTELAIKLNDGQDFTMYKCRNGMTDCASPIIVEGQHLANMFIGQFHLEPPNRDFFSEQAKQFDYPEADYLQAVTDAPVMDEKRLPVILGFLTGFARMVTGMSMARRRADDAQRGLQKQAEQLQRERIAAMSLAEDAEKARRALEARTKESSS